MPSVVHPASQVVLALDPTEKELMQYPVLPLIALAGLCVLISTPCQSHRRTRLTCFATAGPFLHICAFLLASTPVLLLHHHFSQTITIRDNGFGMGYWEGRQYHRSGSVRFRLRLEGNTLSDTVSVLYNVTLL